MGIGKRCEGQQVLPGVAQHAGDVWELVFQGGGDPVELGPHRGAIRLGEDRLDGGDDHRGVGLVDPGQHVAYEADPAPLPTRAHQHGINGRSQPQVLVRDGEVDTRQPPGAQVPEELGQNAPLSESPTATPRSLRPSAETPVAATTAREVTCPATRPFR